MDTSKIIKGAVSNGRYTVTAPIVKEDYGLYLQIEDIELPSTYEVDFSNNENSGTSVTMIGNADGVLIPRQFIASGKDVFAFLYHVGEDFGRTVYKFRIPNKVRPDRTNEEPTPEEQSVIDQAISALNEAVAQTAQDVIDADASAQSAQEYAEQAETARNAAQTYANNASASAQASANSATASAQSASASAQIKADVEDLAEEAQASASASANSATASANSASQAQGYAQSASASAQSAGGYASNAQTSANTASSKATEASTSAQTASTKATESAQSASQALSYKTDAESAKTASQTAQGLAESAKDSAISAKNDAESARDAVQSSAAQITTNAEDITQLKEDLSELESSVATPITEDLAYTPIQRKLLSTSGVIDVASDLYYVTSPIAVTAGETLTITGSANYYNYLWCFFDSSDTIVEYEGAGGSGSAIIQRTKTVTVPNNAVSVCVAYISPRTGAVQRQIGFENNLLGRVEAIEKQMPVSDGKVKLTKTGNSLAVTDITTGDYLTAYTAGSQNGALNFEKYWNSLGQVIKDANDDICPIYYDQSHRCGNHGNYVVFQVLSANHGLTESDIGKTYTSANSISYVLVKVPDANTLWFVNDTANIVSGTPIFNVTVPESPMSGDSVVSFTTATRSQLVPSVNHIVQAIDVDGVPVSTDGEYEGDEVTIFEAYNSINTYAMLAALKANIGNNTNASYYAENLSADLVYATTYSIGAGLKMVVSSKIVILREAVNLTSWGVVQSQQIGHRLYVPYSTDTGVVTTTGEKTYTSAEWADADFPPSKTYQFHTTDDSKGFLVAYNLDYANGISATRKSLVLQSAVTQSGAYKLYPYIISMNHANMLTAGTELSGVALRQLIPLNDTLVSTYDFGGNGYAEIDHLAEGEAIVTISAKYNGKRVEVLHKSSGIAILTTTISGGQLAIYGKGSLSLKLV